MALSRPEDLARVNWNVAQILINVTDGALVGIVLYLVFCRWFPPKRKDPPGASPGGS